MRKLKKGVSFLEIILYIGIFSMFATGAIYFGLDIISIREKVTDKHAADLSAQIVMSRIAYEIRRADDITFNIPSPSSDISLIASGVSNQVYLDVDNIIYLKEGSASPVALTSNQVSVSSLVFTDRSTTNKNSKDIEIDIVITNDDITTNKSSTVELNTPFNDSRKLLVDYSAADASTGVLLDGVNLLTPTSLGSVDIDKVIVAWSPDSGETLDQIVIGANTTNTGGVSSGTEVDVIPNSTINDTISATSFTFDTDMTGVTLSIDYIMLDGSVLETQIEITN